MQPLKTAKLSHINPLRKALVRADLDVPFAPSGEILEPYRLEALLPTLYFLEEENIHPIICGHIGRPKGKEDPKLSTSRLKPFFDAKLSPQKYTLLENLRFDLREEIQSFSHTKTSFEPNFPDKPGEPQKSDTPDNSDGLNKAKEFAQELASSAQIYINDSFATCHREATSITLLPTLLPAYAGIRLQTEVETLSKILNSGETPKIAIVGGVKESKKQAIYALAKRFDNVLVVGKLQKTSEDPDLSNVLYPIDYSGEGFDIGPKTAEIYSKLLYEAKTIVWAGPAGAYDKGYFEGSRQLAKAIIFSKGYSVVGGGDTISCLNQLQMLDKFDFVSTGGGAMLDFLSDKKLPGLEALSYYNSYA